MAEIVLVHGIAQEQKSADTLEAEWLPDLAGGVRAAGYPDLADRIWRDRQAASGVETRMAFYGDLFLRQDVQGNGLQDLDPEAAGVADALAQEWLERAAGRGSAERTREIATAELAYVRGELGQEQGLGAVARTAVNGLARIRWFAPFGMAFASRFVWRALAQVSSYLSDEAVRGAALERVAGLLGPETRAIVGHSLGSVLAYEAAHKLERPLPLLLTLGSPLGLRTIVYEKLRLQPPGFPERVRRWVNVADRDDFVAAEPQLANMFSRGKPPDSRFEGAYSVDNGAKPHQAAFYLTKREVGRAVAGAMIAAT